MPEIQYSEKYYDDNYEYRHVTLTPQIARLLPKGHLLSEDEWRGIGVQQSRGWVHYAIHRPEPHIMLFRRPLDSQQSHQQKAQQNARQVVRASGCCRSLGVINRPSIVNVPPWTALIEVSLPTYRFIGFLVNVVFSFSMLKTVILAPS